MFIFADSGTSGQLRLINPQIACVLMLGSSLFVATWHSPSHGWWSRNEMGWASVTAASDICESCRQFAIWTLDTNAHCCSK